MTRVCHMTSVHPSLDTRIFYKQCTSLAKAGYETFLVAPGDSFERNGVQVLGVPPCAGGRRERMTKTSRAVFKKAVGIDADIYQLHDPELLRYALKIKKRGKTVIFDSHEDYPENIRQKTWIPALLRLPVAWSYSRYQNYVLKRIDGVLYVTLSQRDKLKDVNKKAVMITNYPIIEQVGEDKKVYAANRTLFFAGGIAESWMHENVIKAAARCKDVRYVLCGREETEYLNHLRELPEWHLVDYMGTVPHEQVWILLGESGIGIALLDSKLSGNYGTLGNTKLFEEMAAGIPVLCTASVLWKQIIEANDCGICVDPYDIDAIANAINYLLDNPDIARQMGENGRRAVLEEYNWSVEEKKLLALYRELS